MNLPVNEIFGIPMSGIMIVLLALLAICLLSVAWVAWRRPVIFKLGVRNIPRRKAQTILIVVGLMLSTLIISAALGTGDTLHYSTDQRGLRGPRATSMSSSSTARTARATSMSTRQ